MLKNCIRAFVLVSATAFVALPAGGCRPDDPNGFDSGTAVPISGVPDEAMDAFRKDHPNASLTDVEQQTASTGALLYRFVFIQNGDAGKAMYHADGRRVRPY
ncbi:MAG TPA: hypothetical protein VGN72_14910 [Tepidisphaeraceae bacterium]|jgi:hypothetical protein|nr:hypothetical protein [Tepidisphaeraceae bacterium]